MDSIASLGELWNQMCEPVRYIRVGDRRIGFDQDGSLAGVVWDCALVLARFLSPALVQHKRVLELGSGTGVAGVLCGYIGANEVVLTEMPSHMQHLVANVEKHRPHVSGTLRCLPFLWGDSWNHSCNSYDIILACDCIYEADHAGSTEKESLQESNAIENHRLFIDSILSLAGPTTQIIIAMERRRNASHFELAFFVALFASLDLCSIHRGRLTADSNPCDIFLLRPRTMSATTLSQALSDVLERAPGVLGVLVTDRDGVPLVHMLGSGLSEKEQEGLLEGLLSAVYSVVADQMNKVGLGDNKSITSIYNEFALVHVAYSPLVLTIVTQPKGVDDALALVDPLKKILETLRDTIQHEL